MCRSGSRLREDIWKWGQRKRQHILCMKSAHFCREQETCIYLPAQRRASLSIYQSIDWSVQQKKKAEILKPFSQKHPSHKKDKETMYLAEPRRHRFFSLISVQCEEAQATIFQDPVWNKRLFHCLKYRRKWWADWNQISHFLQHFLKHQAPSLQNGRFWFDNDHTTFRHMVQSLSSE